MSSSVGDADFTVLTVCTGNICRSPAAERLLAARLGPTVRVMSAGTYALEGRPVSPPMDRLIEEAGGSASAFAARQLTDRLVGEADLVLALTRAHRTAVVELRPAAVRTTYTLRQLARLMSQLDPMTVPAGTPAERLRALLPLVTARRGQPPSTAQDDDVEDPYRRGDPAYVAAWTQIRTAVDQIADAVEGRRSPPG